jgi:hypothetical protein
MDAGWSSKARAIAGVRRQPMHARFASQRRAFWTRPKTVSLRPHAEIGASLVRLARPRPGTGGPWTPRICCGWSAVTFQSRSVAGRQSRSFDDIRAMSGLPPASGPPRVIAVGLRSARNGREQSQQRASYSITSSARAMSLRHAAFMECPSRLPPPIWPPASVEVSCPSNVCMHA